MKVHLINKRLITEYLGNNKEAKKNLSTWLTIMTNTDWNALADVNETFGFTSKEGREVKFYIPLSKLRVACRYHFLANRVHLIVRKIEIHEVQRHQVEGAVR